MCGRYTLTVTYEELALRFGAAGNIEGLLPRFNISPSQEAPVVVKEGEKRVLKALRWGLIPPWTKDLKIAHRLINARCETVAERASFRHAFRRRRCLVPADGFFEWKKPAKTPYRVVSNAGLFALAGLWERWEGDGQRLETFAILTTDANEALAPLHDRMPVILTQEDEEEWLSSETLSSERTKELFAPYPSHLLHSYEVSTRVNSPRNEDPSCIDPLG